MFFFSFFWWGLSTRMIEAFRNTPESEIRAEKRLSTWLSCNTSDYIFKHLKRRHLSVVYVPVSILLDAFFYHFIFNCRAAEPWMLSESKISVARALFDQCPMIERLLAVFYVASCRPNQSCASGWTVDTASETKGGWAGVEDITAIECHIIGMKRIDHVHLLIHPFL